MTGDHGSESDGLAEKRGRHFVQSLERGLGVIRCFDTETPRRTLTEVAKEAGLTRAAARRFLLTLVDLSYVHTDGRYFWLGPRVLELGYAYLSGLTIPEVAMPELEALAAEVEESCSVSILDEGDIVYVARVPVSRIMTVSISVGTRFPAYATSMGRVLLAGLAPADLEPHLKSMKLRRLSPQTVTSKKKLREELNAVRKRGWAMVDQELEEGLRSVAAPIHDREGRTVAAINISTHAARRTAKSIEAELLPPLLDAARKIERELKATGLTAGDGLPL
jgi:IclR family pca regulon transcriptional regulator